MKALEKAFKRALLRALGCFIRPVPAETADLSGVRAVLLLRYDRLGDMVISTGLFRLLREQFPRLRVHVLASPANAGVIRHDPHVHKVHVFSKKKPWRYPSLLRELRRERFDAVVNLVFYPSLTGAVLAWLAAPRKALRVRAAVEGALDRFYHLNARRTVWGGARRTMLEETVSLLGVLGGDPEGKDPSPRIYPGRAAEEMARALVNAPFPRVAVNLAAGAAEREWDPGSWEEAVRRILAARPDASVYALAPPGDPRPEGLARSLADRRVHPVPPQDDILVIAAVLARMQVLLTPDTAMVHLADALGVSLVPMYISTEKSVLWRPVSAAFRPLVSPDGTMASLSPADAAAAVTVLLEAVS